MKKIFIMFFVLAAISCSKDEGGSQHFKWLTSGAWRQIDQREAGMTSDYWREMEECEKDDIYFFRKDGYIVQYIGEVSCPDWSPSSSDIGRYFYANDSLLVLEDGELIIDSISNLHLAFTYLEDGDRYTYHYVNSH